MEVFATIFVFFFAIYITLIKLTVTLNIEGLNETVNFTVNEGTVLTSDDVEAKIDFNKLGLADRTISGYYTDKEYKTEFDFNQAITTETAIYVKISEIPVEEPAPEEPEEMPEEEKDETPKTGVNSYLGLATFIIAMAVAGIIYTKKQ